MTEITLPLPPNRSQDTGHWALKHRVKTAYRESCRMPLYAALGPFPGAMQPPLFHAVRIEAVMYVWNLNDPDAIDGRMKWLIDSLVYYRIIPNDTAKHVELGDVTQEFDRKNQRLELRIEEIDAE